MLEESSTKTFSTQKRVKIVEAPLENLPFKANSADAVVASMVLHHISNPHSFYKKQIVFKKQRFSLYRRFKKNDKNL